MSEWALRRGRHRLDRTSAHELVFVVIVQVALPSLVLPAFVDEDGVRDRVVWAIPRPYGTQGKRPNSSPIGGSRNGILQWGHSMRAMVRVRSAECTG